MSHDQLHLIAASVFAAIIGVFGLGGLWYSPVLFGNIWNKESGLDPKGKKGHPAIVFAASFVFGLISAIGTGLIVSGSEFGAAACTGFLIGIGFVGTSFGINYMFGGRSLKLLAIDAGYHTLQFTIYGVIFALWRFFLQSQSQ